ncbi:MAG: hypothetical protein FJ138_05480 [Deltaproteobacteria bacterium]|nr:hypothetical protein [Deltaproteobacteria bacterium]
MAKMSDMHERRWWLILQKSEERLVSVSIDAYRDETGRRYHYDSAVPNHKQLAPGDRCVIRLDNSIVGVCEVEAITMMRDEKVRRRCPRCDSTAIRERKAKRPALFCPKCQHLFEEAAVTSSEVISYDARLVLYRRFLSAPAVEEVKGCAQGKDGRLDEGGKSSQLSILHLSTEAVEELLKRYQLAPLTPEPLAPLALAVGLKERSAPLTPPHLILQGPPGTGKSHRLNARLTQIGVTPDTQARVVGHADLTSADLIGVYRPVMRGESNDLTYSFREGPLTRLLKEALHNPNRLYVLIIEEINRANPASLLAEIFQLLDRVDSPEGEDAPLPGWSATPADLGEDVRTYLEIDDLPDLAQDHLASGVRLPPNFGIWATMNTADQGVFPMDTAFRRRWTFEYMGVDDRKDVWEGNESGWNPLVPGYLTLRWQALRQAINNTLERARVEEDRQLGPFFLSRRELRAEPRELLDHLLYKVIAYLRQDVVRHTPEALFAAEGPDEYVPGLAGLCRKARAGGLLSIFKEGIVKGVHQWEHILAAADDRRTT